jgi:hypothetical protein
MFVTLASGESKWKKVALKSFKREGELESFVHLSFISTTVPQFKKEKRII